MNVTIVSLSELIKARREQEYSVIAEMASQEYSANGNLSYRQAIFRALRRCKVNANEQDLDEIENRMRQFV